MGMDWTKSKENENKGNRLGVWMVKMDGRNLWN